MNRERRIARYSRDARNKAGAIEFGDTMKARIASGEIDVGAARMAAAELALRLEKIYTSQKTSLLSPNEVTRWEQLAESGVIDPEACLTRGSQPLYSALIKKPGTDAILEKILPFHPNPNSRAGRDNSKAEHPLIATQTQPRKFYALLNDSRIDYCIGTSNVRFLGKSLKQTLDSALQRYEKEPKGKKFDRKGKRTELDEVVQSIRYAMDKGIELPALPETLFKDELQAAHRQWQQVCNGECRLSELNNQSIMHLASLYGMHAVFAPPLWHSEEKHALDLINRLHPSLQCHPTREVAALSSAQQPQSWRMHVSAPSVREQGI